MKQMWASILGLSLSLFVPSALADRVQMPEKLTLPIVKPLGQSRVAPVEPAPVIHAGLSGLWVGDYRYRDNKGVAVPFANVLRFMSDRTVVGVGIEPNTFGSDKTAIVLQSNIHGQWNADANKGQWQAETPILWSKDYNGVGGVNHRVTYDGVLSLDKQGVYHIEGRWRIGSGSGGFSLSRVADLDLQDAVIATVQAVQNGCEGEALCAQRAKSLNAEVVSLVAKMDRIAQGSNTPIQIPKFNNIPSLLYIRAYADWTHALMQAMQQSMLTKDFSLLNAKNVQEKLMDWEAQAKAQGGRMSSEDLSAASIFIKDIATTVYQPYAQKYSSFVVANTQPITSPLAITGQNLLDANPKQDWRGEWDVVVTSTESGRSFNSLWLLGQEGSGIFGASEWDCCPTYRVDKLTGTFRQNSIELVRHVNEQDREKVGSLIQIYTGTREGDRIVGKWNGPTQPTGGDFVATRRGSVQETPSN